VGGHGSGSCPVAGFGNSGVEPSCSATKELVSWILRKEFAGMGGGWNWLRFVSSGGL
jgi:hypothetical protein